MQGLFEHYGALSEEYFMSKKVFVGGISWNTDNEGLREAFERFGEVVDTKSSQTERRVAQEDSVS